jgi:hypothetical protein
VSVPTRRVIVAVSVTLALTVSTAAHPVSAQVPCIRVPNGASPNRNFNSTMGTWNVEVSSRDECSGGVVVSVVAHQTVPGDRAPVGNDDHPRGPTGILTLPIFCRRDDYLFLPPTSLGGLPCVGIPSQSRFDPYPIAVQIDAQLPPPALLIGMNPALGMVAVPTWFWVEGYDGGVLSQSETVLESHENCHYVPVRDSAGQVLLDADGRPRVRRECSVETSTFTVDVRLWPNRFAWDFGDDHRRSILCPGQGDCGDALGLPFIDSAHPSPVQHPYRWTSLGVNGTQDAYTIRLGITFGAQYRVTVNGSTGGWRGLPERDLAWSASHQVREAQAVLTRP